MGKWKDEFYDASIFHPVLAPGLPGMMASCAVLCFYSLFFCCLLFVQLFFWLPELFNISVDYLWNSSMRFALTCGTSLIVKVAIFDRIIGRKFLTNDLGFVEYWLSFCWYFVFV